MQDKAKKTKKKQALVYKPYLKGKCFTKDTVSKGLHLMLYYLVFIFMYFILGPALQFGGPAMNVTANLLLVMACGGMVYMNGAKQGEEEVTLGEISYIQKEQGRKVDEKDTEKCFHPLKGLTVVLVGCLPILLLSIPYAFMAKEQVYMLQSLPTWTQSYASQEEVVLPLAYYNRPVSVDVLRLIVRILIFPFANIGTLAGPDVMLLVDRLSPILACLPALGYALGYATGPRARAMVHADIKTSNKRKQHRDKKAMKAKQNRERMQKKNELI